MDYVVCRDRRAVVEFVIIFEIKNTGGWVLDFTPFGEPYFKIGFGLMRRGA
jgi:hypothetical protein